MENKAILIEFLKKHRNAEMNGVEMVKNLKLPRIIIDAMCSSIYYKIFCIDTELMLIENDLISPTIREISEDIISKWN